MAEVGSWYYQLPRYVLPLLPSILQEHGFDLRSNNYEITSVLADLWVSSVYRLKITHDTNTVSFYTKCLPSNFQRRNVFDSQLQFRNETMFYNKEFTELLQFEKETLSQDSYAPIRIPKCYSADSDGDNDVLIMEDLSCAGSIVLSCLKTMELHELLVMK
jgi:hypothetical protein